MNKTVLYIHGQGGSAQEAEHYLPLFDGCKVVGLDYTAQTPWEAEEEFPRLFDSLCAHSEVTLIANSIGAYFAMCALADKKIERAYFISPVVDMEKLIGDMMGWAGVSEEELCEKGEVRTDFGQTLSWNYLTYVRRHPPVWVIPTHILYGSADKLTSLTTVLDFARKTGATLTVMDGGEHWFHTEEQMRFLDNWIILN